MQALIQTLFDILRLRKGPEAIPYSPVVFALTLAMWVAAGLAANILSPESGLGDVLPGLAVGLAGTGCYALIVVLTGNRPRLLQTVTAILGCSALLTLLFAVESVFLSPLGGQNVTGIVVLLILCWSIAVEGHIIARAINRHWYIGIVAAIAVFFFQLYVYQQINPVPVPTITEESIA